jgi:hypothetical protein
VNVRQKIRFGKPEKLRQTTGMVYSEAGNIVSKHENIRSECETEDKIWEATEAETDDRNGVQ